MTTLHFGVPGQIPDGFLASHDVTVRLQRPPKGWTTLPADVTGLPSLTEYLASFFDVQSGDSWAGRAPGDAVIGTLGELLDLPSVPYALRNELIPAALERLNIALDVLSSVPVYVEVPNTMKWLTTQIHASLGGVEELVHVINWRHDGAGNGADPAVGSDTASLQAFGDRVRDEWTAAFLGGGTGGGTARGQGVFGRDLLYDLVKTSLVSLDNAGGSTAQQGATAVSPITSTVTNENPLPYEVAACATLRTVGRQTGGHSHGRENRGRLYFGGLSTICLASTGGTFGTDKVNLLAANLGAFYDAVHTATDHHAAVISQAHLLSHPITMIQMGLVPDSQRRRRKSQDESRSAIWSGQLDTVTVS